MASFFSFSSPVDVDVRLDGEDARKQVEIMMDKAGKEKCPIYFDGESVKGSVCSRSARVPPSPAHSAPKGPADTFLPSFISPQTQVNL